MIEKLIGPVTGLLDKFIEDKDQKNALAHEIATMSQKYAQEIAKGQMAINQVEAAHKSLFVVAGGPPWAGVRLWMFWELHYIPFTNFVYGLLEDRHSYPSYTFGDHDACVMGMLGLVDLEHMRSTKAYTGISNV